MGLALALLALGLGFVVPVPLPPLALLVITGVIVEDFLLLGYQVVTVPVKLFLAQLKAIEVIAIVGSNHVFFAGSIFSQNDHVSPFFGVFIF